MLYILQQYQFVGREVIMYLRTQKQYEIFFGIFLVKLVLEIVKVDITF